LIENTVKTKKAMLDVMPQVVFSCWERVHFELCGSSALNMAEGKMIAFTAVLYFIIFESSAVWFQ